MNKLQRTIRYYKLRFLRLKGDPGSIARGVALGTFIGITPNMPLHTIVTVIVAPLLRANLVGAFLASFTICNPLTYFPQYYLSWLIGKTVTPYDLTWERIKAVMDVVLSGAGFQVSFNALSHLGIDAVIVMCVGGSLLAAPFTIVAYLLTFRFFAQRRSRKRWPHRPS